MSTKSLKIFYTKEGSKETELIELTAEEILALAGFKNAKVAQAEFRMEDKGSILTACSYDNADYVGMNVDGAIGGHLLWLSNAELPSPENNHITTRLYAGDIDTETGDPVAFMQYGPRSPEDESHRLVYVDSDYASTRDWKVATRFSTTEKGE